MQDLLQHGQLTPKAESHLKERFFGADFAKEGTTDYTVSVELELLEHLEHCDPQEEIKKAMNAVAEREQRKIEDAIIRGVHHG